MIGGIRLGSVMIDCGEEEFVTLFAPAGYPFCLCASASTKSAGRCSTATAEEAGSAAAVCAGAEDAVGIGSPVAFMVAIHVS